ncbi:unnamed protein product, partial [Gongylonema pulchrum]|uniref:Transposase n=1 Tax=Gongylonema pulchrum TaxID=637853 RepID=A0A183EP19_9BILA
MILSIFCKYLPQLFSFRAHRLTKAQFKLNLLQNKLDEANEALQQMNQAQEETARMRLRVHGLGKTGSGCESRIEALNRKIADFESQVRLTRDDYDLRLSQRDKRVVELQEIGRLLKENQDKFDLGVQLNTELKPYQESRYHIYCFSRIFLIAASPAAPGDRFLNVLFAYFGWLRAVKGKRFIAFDGSLSYQNIAKKYKIKFNSDCDIEIEEHVVDGKFIKLCNKGDQAISIGQW